MKSKYIVIENDGEPFSQSRVTFYGTEQEQDEMFQKFKKDMKVSAFLYKATITMVAYAKPTLEIIEDSPVVIKKSN